LADFELWLANEEKNKTCKFRLKSCTSGAATEYFFCHRSGYYSSEVNILNRKRQLKSTGSLKIDGTCTAYIIKKTVEQKINITYCSTHFGHQANPGILPISSRASLAGKN